MQNKQNQIYWHNASVSRKERETFNGHPSVVIWFTGISGSGKSTLAHEVEQRLFSSKKQTFVLDGDNIRHGINSNLGFTPTDRSENLRRVAEICKLFLESGTIVLAAFISPLEEDRSMVRSFFPESEFFEVYCKCSVEVCESRDPKGIYKRVRSGEIKNFTGISAPYEEPINPDLVIETDKLNIEESVERILLELNQTST